MEGKIKPIETYWRGYRFRSRLEARWAVVFESLRLDWAYEEEGFDLGDGTFYLPDFTIRGMEGRGPSELYVEVKGHMTEDDMAKVRRFAESYPVYIVGDIPKIEGQGSQWFEAMEDACYEWPYPYNFETVDGDLFGAFLGINGVTGKAELFGDDSNYLIEAHPWVMNAAFTAGKQARFEHGERPEDALGFSTAQEVVLLIRKEYEAGKQEDE